MAPKTKEIIISAFLELLESKGFDKITVTDLVEKCAISRQTFYYHFDDISKMLEWSFNRDAKAACEFLHVNCSNTDIQNAYTNFAGKYDIILKKAIITSQFIEIYNLLYKSYYAMTTMCINKKFKSAGKNFEFIISCITNIIVGMTIQEVQKDKQNYHSLFEKLNTLLTANNQ